MDSIELGFDIATSITIVGAAISFLLSQRKARRVSEAQFAITNLQGFLSHVRERSKEFDDHSNAYRQRVVQISDSANRQSDVEKAAQLRASIEERGFEVMHFLQGIRFELDAQLKVYFPIFSPKNKAPESMVADKEKIDGILADMTSGEHQREEMLDLVDRISKEIGPALHRLEMSVARELQDILRHT